jgi:hypothetical protein
VILCVSVSWSLLLALSRLETLRAKLVYMYFV